MAALGFCEPNCDWLRILTSRKSFSGSSSQTLVFGGDKRQPEIRLHSQAREVVPYYSKCSLARLWTNFENLYIYCRIFVMYG